MGLILRALLVAWTLVAAVHLTRFFVRRHLGSLLVAAYPLGWGVLAARELHWLPRAWADWAVAGGLVLGGFFVALHLWALARRWTL